jgi:hypothetical protein
MQPDETIINFEFDASLFTSTVSRAGITTTIVRYYVIENLLNKYLSRKIGERRVGGCSVVCLHWGMLTHIEMNYFHRSPMCLPHQISPCLKCHKFNWKFNLSTWKFSIYILSTFTYSVERETNLLFFIFLAMQNNKYMLDVRDRLSSACEPVCLFIVDNFNLLKQ